MITSSSQVQTPCPRSPGLREKMEAALDRFEELSAALTRLQEKLEYVTAPYPQPGNECGSGSSPDNRTEASQAEITLSELLDRLQTLTVRVGCMTQQVRT